ncbi:MAG: FRG domain-containing protein [Thermodesulfobacteriota bacterium]
MITPNDHYKEHDRVIEKLGDARKLIADVNSYAASKNLAVFWRGQADHSWGLHSSLARQLASATVLNDELLNKVEDAILEEAGIWIKDLSKAPFSLPLSRLAYLQHHGIPTRLIDFTRDPSVALFFAAETNDEVDGRIFALLVEQTEVLSSSPAGTPWRRYKSNEVKVWDPTASGVVFPRLEAQEGVFAVGRLPSTQPHRKAWDPVLGKDRSLLAEEVRRVLSVPFKLCGSEPIPNRATLPIGITFRLHVNKESIRHDLQRRKGGLHHRTITHKLIYPDIDGMRSHSPFLKGMSKGTLVLP